MPAPSSLTFTRGGTSGIGIPLGVRKVGRPGRSGSGHSPAGVVAMDIEYVQPIVTLALGVLILILPRILNYAVAAYLIFAGLSQLLPLMNQG